MHLFLQKQQKQSLASGKELLITHFERSFGLVLGAFICDVKKCSKKP